ncbi:MAG: cytochrome P450 [Planctomycetes bacterium]|nr:cytochrome P450 [Planctomycetota bacterium]
MQGMYPPGPKDGLLGVTLLRRFQRSPMQFVTEVARQYGDFSFVRFGWVRFYMVNRPELIREVLVTKLKSFHKLGRIMRSLRKIEGNGLVVAEGEPWKRHRPVVQVAFHNRHMGRFAQVMVEHTRRRIDCWKPGVSFDLAEEMNQLALEIVADVVFNVDWADRAEQLRDAVHVAREAMQREIANLILSPEWVPWPWRLKQRKALRTIDDLIWSLIRDRRASGVIKEDMLSLMLAAAADVGDGPPISDLEIRDEAATLFVAGHDTTSAALAWFWYLMARNPDKEKRVRDEVDAVLQGRAAGYADAARLPYTEMAVRESMRLYPAAGFLFGREAIEDTEIGGYPIKRGSWLFIAPYVVHRDPKYFKDPEAFDPERFAPGRVDEIPSYAYIPFGGGPRICIGNNFAITEIVLVAATVLQRFQLVLDQAEVEPELEVVLRPKGGMRMRAVPRTPSSEGAPAHLSFAH